MILITGATGNLGNAVIQYVRKKMAADSFAAFARNSEKVKQIESEGVQGC